MKKITLSFLLLACFFSANINAQCTPTGNQTDYGTTSWIGYVYNNTANTNPSANLFNTTNYRGFITQNETFNYDLVNGSVSGPNLCGTYANQFAIRFKKIINFPAGFHVFTVGGDDGYRLSLDGGATFIINNWGDHAYQQSVVTVSLSGNTNVVLEYYENTGQSRVSFSYCSIPSVDPSVFGNNAWNVYGFETQSMTPALSTYRGFYTQNTLGANTQDIANNGWNTSNSPSASSGWNGCPLSNDNFTFVQKRRGFPCGRYDLFMRTWDDATRVLLDGIEIFNQATWFLNGPGLSLGNHALNANSTLEIITIENGGSANARLNITLTSNAATYNGTTWSSPPADVAITVSGNLDLTSDLNVCSCTVNSGAVLTLKDGKTLVVQENIAVSSNSNIIVENNASLVQVNDAATSTGSINVIRNSTAMKQLDYTYWSSPVAGFTLSNFSNTNVFYAFNPATGVNNWVSQPSSTIMQIGKGYIVRAPVNALTTQIVESNFRGVPNTGIINIPITKGAVGRFNLIGNPYPSAIDADLFLANTANASKITGTIYLWTHNTAIAENTPNPGSGTFAYTSNDYAKYNLTGPIKGMLAASGGVLPTGKIASGQGFFVEAIGAVGTTNLILNNSMRVKVTNSNSNFFKTQNKATVASDNTINTIQKNRVWLNLINSQGAYDEMLLGYVSGATNDFDYGFDGKVFSAGNYVSLYSILGTENLSIQGRDIAFNDTEIIPIGYKSKIEGSMSIGIENIDGFFEKQDVFLVDKTNNTTTNLKQGRYTFTASKGTFDNRFELKFRDATLGNESPIVNTNEINVFTDQNQLIIKSKTENIKSVLVYDLLGRMIYQKEDINNSDFSSDQINASKQIVIVKVKLENDKTTVKKVILN